MSLDSTRGPTTPGAAHREMGTRMSSSKMLEVKHLRKHFPIQRGLFRKRTTLVKAVDDVSFDVFEGETLGLVGESGCGKTTLGRCLIRVYEPTSGQILYHERNGATTDLAALERNEVRRYHTDIRMIFQDPHSSLNPRMTVLGIVGEPLRNHGIVNGSELEDRVAELLRQVGLRPEYVRRYPHAFSGGERQRIGIARALALNPRLVIADEPVSALDVSVQAQTLNLLLDLREQFGLTYVFVAHDLSVVEHISDRVAVMYVGLLVEVARKEILYCEPRHPYTEALLSAVPRPDPLLRDKGRRIRLGGEVADPANAPSGCYFHPRCPYALELCAALRPELVDVGDGHHVACHRATELTLRGVVSREDLQPPYRRGA